VRKAIIILLSTALVCAASQPVFDVTKLTAIQTIMYGAMRAGWSIGRAGATEDEFKSLFMSVTAGDVGKVQEFLNKKATKP
jgi:hypothetical protein